MQQKYIFTILFLLFSSMVFSQSVKQKLDSIVSPGVTKEIFQYDLDGRVKIKIYQKWDKANWINTSKNDYFYNADGKYNSVISYKFSEEDGEWVEEYNSTYLYDNFKLKQISYNYWNINKWEEYQKEDYSYTTFGGLQEMTRYYWGYPGWYNSVKEEYVYDNDERLSSKTSFGGTWNGYWEEESKNAYSYNAEGNLAQDIYSSASDGVYDEVYRTDYTYNENGHLLFNIVAYPGAEEDSEKYEYTFNFNHPVSDIWVNNEYEWDYMLTERTDNMWDSDENEWLEIQSYLYYYSNTTTTALNRYENNDNIAVYPNLFNENITVTIEDGTAVFTLYNADGQQLLMQEIRGNTTISTQSVPSGIYFYQLNTAKCKHSGKLVKN